MILATILPIAFSSLAAALPSANLNTRAGGPVAKPIPDSCAVNYLFPPFEQGFIPAPSASNALLYNAYYEAFRDKEEDAKQCREQCYGYGDSTQCKTSFWADNLEVPEGYYGSPGGTYYTAGCLLFNRTLSSEDFITAPEGQGTTPVAVTIQC